MPRLALIVLAGASLILALSMGVRHAFGLFVSPVMLDLGLSATAISFALAIQNLIRGLAQPLFGMAADRFGPVWVLLAGGLLYGGGLAVMASGDDLLLFNIGAGWLVGLGISATGLPVVLGAVARLVPADRRSGAFGVVTAIGSGGQFVMAPVTQGLIVGLGWSLTTWMLAVSMLLVVPLALVMRTAGAAHERSGAGPVNVEHDAGGVMAAAAEAFGQRAYWLVIMGFFTCGFHVTFIAVHLPGYLESCGMPPALAGWSIGLVGLFNMLGTWVIGHLGDRFPKKYLLSALYTSRALIILGFISLPVTPLSVIIASALLGMTWLATVPVTSGLVATIFGARYLSTLFGIVFLSHQVGAFLGAWLGGYLFDVTGSYMEMWLITAGLAVFSALVHLPVRERPLHAPAAA
jgi:MFS family permease